MSFNAAIPLGMTNTATGVAAWGLRISAAGLVSGALPSVTLSAGHTAPPLSGVPNGLRVAIGGTSATGGNNINGDYQLKRAAGTLTGMVFNLDDARRCPAAGTLTVTNSRLAVLMDETPFLNSDGATIAVVYAGFTGQAQLLGLDANQAVLDNFYSGDASTATVPAANTLGVAATGWVDKRVEAGYDPLPAVTTLTHTEFFQVSQTRRMAMRAVTATAGTVAMYCFQGTA